MSRKGFKFMKKYKFLFLFLILFQNGFAQSNSSWKGYFSYNEIKDISQSPTLFIAAAENAVFSKNLTTNTLKTKNTIDGLSGQTISSIYHSPTFNKTLIGYKNGLMIIVNEADGSLLNVVDIITNSVNQNLKGINHFMEYEGIIYISCDFGIVQYNLSTLGFGDTYRIGDFGTEIKVTQTAVFNGIIYASTNSGIRKAAFTNPNLNDYNQWSSIAGGSWDSIETFGNNLFAIANWGEMYKLSGTTLVSFATLSSAAEDMRTAGDYLVVTTPSKVTVFNQNLNVISQINSNQLPVSTSKFSCATVLNDIIYMGTAENGVVTTTLSSPSNFEMLAPDGPLRNAIFRVKSTSDAIWAVFGGYSSEYNPYTYNSFNVNTYGISKFMGTNWTNIPYESVLGAKAITWITLNPNDSKQVYFSSFFSGLLKLENDIPTILFNNTNSGLESLSTNSNDIRINGTAFDKSGNLWMTNSLIKNSLKVYKANNQWISYSMESILDQYQDDSYGNIEIDKNGTKWIASNHDGVIAFNENNNSFKKITAGADLGNLPHEDVRAVAIDRNNQLWIGTVKGLRVLSSVDRFSSGGQMSANSIIILEDGLAQELLYQQFITDIVVDGANNKWIGTADSGVFMVSSNGQQTIYRFNTSNSPLPSNSIYDIDINGTTGEVFIATDKGMVSFKGSATNANEDLNNVVVYPNPVRPEYTGTVKISGLLDNCNVKITDIEGNLVHEAIAEGGTIEWDTSAFGKYKVASGVYMIFVSAKDGVETKVKKVMIIR